MGTKSANHEGKKKCNFNCFKINNSCAPKDTLLWVKKQGTKGEKIFVTYDWQKKGRKLKSKMSKRKNVIILMAKKHVKRCSTLLETRKWKLKPQDTIYHLPDWQKL